MKRPLIFYAISTAVGCLCAMEILENSITICSTIAVLFFIIYFTTLDKKFFIINAVFFSLAAFSFLNYFNFNPGSHINKIKLLNKKNYYFIGSINGRKVIVNGKVEKLKEGSSIEAYGSFKKDMNFTRGIIGNYKLEKYKLLKRDIMYYSYSYKKLIYNKFKNIIGEDRTALIMGICYGDVHYLTQEQNQEFQKLGVIHAVSVSGFHMAIIYQAIEGIFGFNIAVLFSIIYVFFTGMSAATMRSFIMIFIYKLSKIFFKEYDGLSSLSLSAIILIMAKPYYIVDIGFGLSFLATLGILVYYKKLSRVLYMMPKKLNESISLTLSSQVFSLPYVAFTIQNFSYGFMLGNLFLLPLYSILVVLGNIALVVSFLKPVFNIIAKLINLVIEASEGGSSIVLKLTPEIVYLNYEQGIIMLLIYISFKLYKSGYKKMKYMPAALFIFIVLQSYSIITKVTFLNFQSGEAVILDSRNQRVMICNYDSYNGKWIVNIKKYMNIDKVITNPGQNYRYILNKNSFLSVNSSEKNNSLIVKFHRYNKEKFNFILNGETDYGISKTDDNSLIYIPKVKINDSSKYEDPLDKSITYGIIFNRLIPIEMSEKR
ncbi:ComEC/Rec2 family competence protein [Clostridium tyrobutyricum]|uniref:ComEC/Rec2 family competence protein n=1 Tax=Clostridium tyrobutyricum TaxID=1519 RepID=UPI0010AB25C8|nr:ComEC/Rec2 family competence protein [Clostridium tyrobutyricum]QCH28754.1 ComEC family competence protein [Clostridium tyrobutyricum]